MLAEDRAYYDKYRKFYNKYQKVRKVKLRLNPVCERCIVKGIVVDVHEVHHIIPISEGKTYEEKYMLATDIKNLESLCKDCHLIEHNRYTIPEEFW